MTIIVAIRSSNAVVVASDSQRISSVGVSEAPCDKTFKVNSLIGAHAGLLEFSGLPLKVHVERALADNQRLPHDAVRAIAAYVCPILQNLGDSEVDFECRIVDIIIASRSNLASVRLAPNMQLHKIEPKFCESASWFVAGADQAMKEAVHVLSRHKSLKSLDWKKLRELASKTIKSAIGAGGMNHYHQDVPNCCEPVHLRHIQ